MTERKIVFLMDRPAKRYTGLIFSYKRAFEGMGYQCEIKAYNVNHRLNRLLSILPFAQKKYLESVQKKIIHALSLNDAGIVFVMKGYFVLPETLNIIHRLNEQKTIVCFYPDDPLSTLPSASNERVRACIPLYDAYFIWNKALMKPLEQLGAKKVTYIPFGLDDEIIFSPKAGVDTPKKSIDVSFIGSGDNDRARFLAGLGAALKDIPGSKKIFGSWWQTIESFELFPSVSGPDFLNVMHCSKINLNLLREQNKNSHNMRTFEIPGAGGFMLHEYSDDAAGFFKEGVEAEFYRSVDECADKIKYYLKHEFEREEIALAGYNKVISADYTYKNLARQIEKRIESTVQITN